MYMNNIVQIKICIHKICTYGQLPIYISTKENFTVLYTINFISDREYCCLLEDEV